MVVTIIELPSFEAFDKYTETIDPQGPPVLFYFTGAKLENGVSWCPDCNDAEPVIKAFLSELNKDVIFATVDVGDMTYWRDKACPFRTDNRLKLMVIPTIIIWKGVQRLEGTQCAKRDLLQMLFEDEE